MMRMSRRNGVVVAVLLSLPVLVTGCMSTTFDQANMGGSNGYSQTARGVPNQTAPPPYGANLPTGGDLRQTSYRPPQAPFTGQVQGRPDDVIVENAPPDMPPVMMAEGNPPVPRELIMTTHAPHRVAAPDILLIEALRMIPKGPYRLEAMEVLQIEVTDTLPKQDIKGLYMISPDGKINLGHTYGSLQVGGLTVEQAQLAIRNFLNPIIKGANVNVALVQMRAVQNVRGDHLVRPDGTISLGMYGSVFVAGMTLGEVKRVVEAHLSVYLVDPQISVDVKAYNSRKIYIVADTLYNFRQQVIALPATGNETVLDAISKVQGLNQTASLKKIWIARPSPAGHPCSTILPVDWQAITQAGRTETNYQLLPGDRIYIAADPFYLAYFNIDKMLAPFERVLQFAVQTASLNQLLRSNANGGVLVAP